MNKPLRNAIGDLLATAEAEQLTVARYRAGLQAIVSDADVIPWPFAEALLRGASVEDAKAAAGPLAPPSEAVEQSYQRLLARRALVKAALRWADAPDNELYQEAIAALYAAVAAFRAAGGSEVTG